MRPVKSVRQASVILAAALACAFFVPARPALASHVVYEEGPILGTTSTAIDIEVGTGISRADVRFEMAVDPRVYVFTPAARSALHPGVEVGLVMDRRTPAAAVRTVVIYPAAMAGGRPQRYPWEMPHGDTIALRGRVASTKPGTRALDLTVSFGGHLTPMSIPSGVPIVELRTGSREDLRSPAPALVIATQAQYEIYGVVDAIVVASGISIPPL